MIEPLFVPVMMIAAFMVLVPIGLWIRDEWKRRGEDWDGWL